MKRNADGAEDDEVEDDFYESIRKVREEQRARLRSYTDDPCPAAPIENIDELFVAMEKMSVSTLRTHSLTYTFQCWNGDDRGPVNDYFDIDWWRCLVKWHRGEMEDRQFAINRLGGTYDQTMKALADVQRRCSQVREAICDGWNDKHPQVPGKWNLANNAFSIKYTE